MFCGFMCTFNNCHLAKLWLMVQFICSWHLEIEFERNLSDPLKQLVIPHDSEPGYVVVSVPFYGQKYSLSVSCFCQDFESVDVSKYFVALDNGDVVTAGDISSLLNYDLKMTIFSAFSLKTGKEEWIIKVQNGRGLLRFSQQVYVGHVKENIPRYSVVEGLEDLDASIGENIKTSVRYDIIAGALDLFDLHQSDCDKLVVRTLVPLDFEKETQYMIAILASTRNMSAFARIWIMVNKISKSNKQENKPCCTAVVRNGSLIGATVVQMLANYAKGNKVELMLENSDDEFGVDIHNGTIYLRKNSDDLKNSMYCLIVNISDNDTEEHVTAFVRVAVEGWREAVKRSVQSNRIRREVRPELVLEVEETETGVLMDLKNSDYEMFSFEEPKPKQLEINSIKRVIQLRTGEHLDFETQPLIKFVIHMMRIYEPMYFEEQAVLIKVLDVNDEIPEFMNVPKPFLATVTMDAAMGTSVYQLIAYDADQDSVVRYVMESGGEDRFIVDPENGIVRTRGKLSFRDGKEYEIAVSAQDVNAKTLQKSAISSLKILVGEREPQFFENLYVANVLEATKGQYGILEISAFSHQGRSLIYDLTTESGVLSNVFSIDHNTGVVDLLQVLDYENDPQQYHFQVRAIERGSSEHTSSVSVVVNLIDINDNVPTFPLSQYVVQGIAETVAVGTDIIQVTATDLDSVTNSQLTYSVNDNNFVVQTLNNIGYIKTAKRLDYDNVDDHTYSFTIIATDNGIPSQQGSATVRVSVTNVNDEDPVFVNPVEVIHISKDAPKSTVFHIVQAYDPDGDGIIFTFSGGRLSNGPFNVDPKTGILTLVDPLDKFEVAYRLNISAVDNGACCGGTTSRRSNGLVLVEVKDINNNAPKFVNCFGYNPMVMENENVGTSVITVKAVDLDSGANGNVTYSLVKSSNKNGDKFDIHPLTGVIRTTDIFDREGQTGVTDFSITVKAEDQGRQKLAGFCSFRIKIGDRNDNPPVFSMPHYTAVIEENSIIGKRIKQVFATDRDAGENGKVEYFILADPSGFFVIDRYSGWLSVTKRISTRTHDIAVVEVEAHDKGFPMRSAVTRIEVEIIRGSNPSPHWVTDYSLVPVLISENAPVNTVVKQLRATSPLPHSPVHYIIQQSELLEQSGQSRSFYIQVDQETNEMSLLTYKTLDYEALPQYILIIKASNRAVSAFHNDTRLVIDVEDENDEIPQFVGLDENGRYSGSVAENLDPGAEVITVTANDRDTIQKYRQILYSIKNAGTDFSKFSIDRKTGVLRTLASFDCEVKKEYYITVIAEDGAPSARPNHYPPGTPNQGEAEVKIQVIDVCDNVPYFVNRLYMVRVSENTRPGTIIMKVTAEDMDEDNHLTYSIIGGNIGNTFELVPDLGQIKLRGRLDYESFNKEYRLTYQVFDGKFLNSTAVIVQVVDVNDNAPRFDNTIYNVTDIVEEEPGISKNNHKYLLAVRATDADVDRNSIIRYSLSGQFANDGTFYINDHTGEIYLTRSLDRDHLHGRLVWNFNVLAHDEVDQSGSSLIGFAEVRILPRDINDNAPVFDRNRLIGKIPEHSRAGMTVLTVIATDADSGNNGTVIYSLKQVPTNGDDPLFSIDSHMGLISTVQNNALDREIQSEYFVVVQAKDKGSPPLSSSATVTILIDDVNDHIPHFTQSIYRTVISESHPLDASVISVSATDLDAGNNARLTYVLQEHSQEFFYISTVAITNSGVLKILKLVDFESLAVPVFNITVYAHDPDPNHVDSALIEVAVTDFNDNPPVFVQGSKKVTIYENATVGTTLHRFTAMDRDSGINKQFTIDKSTDTECLFSVDSNGLVTTTKHLDRERLPGHRIHILAIDKGQPPLTGSGTLIVNLMDVNDNFPEFAADYHPVINENQPPGQTVIQFSAVDRDTLENGAPFEFWLPCSGSCPCHGNPTCNDFTLKFLPEGGKNGVGVGVVTSLRMFDRETCKEFHLPVIMKDSGHPSLSGTNTLTITIGDLNDNRHFAGQKNVIFFNYKGQFQNVPLGTVYVKDVDDWDSANKSFSFASPKEAETSFRLDNITGMLYAKTRLMEGSYSLKVRVYDAVWKREVVSSVAIQVKDIADEAVFNSGSLRLYGVTAEAFLKRPEFSGMSKYDLLQKTLAKKLDIPLTNVDIFTVLNHPTLMNTIDIRYSAKGATNFLRSTKLNGHLAVNQKELEEILGAHRITVPVDECLNRQCEHSCYNHLVIGSKALLVNDNDTSLLGVTAYVRAECGFSAGDGLDGNSEIECQPNSCLNGGTCLKQGIWKVECRCLEGFDGPRCQQVKHSFFGNGWAWFEPLAPSKESHTSLEFITLKENGLLLYDGPVTGLQDGKSKSFIILELQSGYPVLRVNFGSGEIKLAIDGKDKQGQIRFQKLSDGLWHKLDFFRTGRMIRFVVDECEKAEIIENEHEQMSYEDRRACETFSETPDGNDYTSVSTVLQLGGQAFANAAIFRHFGREGFSGCIKNLFHNGKLHDLHVGLVGESHNSEDGCQREDWSCGKLEINSESFVPALSKCGVNAQCTGSFRSTYHCFCNPGWRGHKCSLEAPVKDFLKHSFLEWTFKDGYYADLNEIVGAHRTDIQLRFRTRSNSGMLLSLQNAQKSEYLILEIRNCRLIFRYNLGSGEELVSLVRVNVSDGIWHTANVHRVGRWTQLKLDSGDERNFNQSFGLPGGHLEIHLSQHGLFAGGDARYPSPMLPPLVGFDLKNSCMSDIRVNGEWFPMDKAQNKDSRAADILAQSQNTVEGCSSEMCLSSAGLKCPPSLICIDFWRYAECRCPVGRHQVSGSSGKELCESIDECLEVPFLCNYGTCHDTDDGYYCRCYDGYNGSHCSVKQAMQPNSNSNISITVVVVCVALGLLILLLFLIFMVINRFRQRRRQLDSYTSGIDPYDDVRENIIHYDEEGVGEADQDVYDIDKLKKPPNHQTDSHVIKTTSFTQDNGSSPVNNRELVAFMNQRLWKVDNDLNIPPHDSVREYAYEGSGSIADSLSSLDSV